MALFLIQFRYALWSQSPILYASLYCRLRKQYTQCTEQMLSLLEKPRVGIKPQLAALGALMEFARSELPGDISPQLCRDALEALVGGKGFSPDALEALVQYMQHLDVQQHALQAIRRLSSRSAHVSLSNQRSIKRKSSSRTGEQNTSSTSTENDIDDDDNEDDDLIDIDRKRERAGHDDLIRNCFDVLTSVPLNFEDFAKKAKAESNGSGGECHDDSEVKSWCNAACIEGSQRKRKRGGGHGARWKLGFSRRKAFRDAWFTLLQQEMPSDVYRKVLMHIPENVIPHMPNPLLLSDFLSGAVSVGGFDGMLALGGLFKLITEHGFEYQGFYRRVYGLLSEDAFYSPHRKRFFDLLSTFLRSSLLSAYNAAAFMKQVGRLSLRAPPHGCLVAIALIHNLARRHPACTVLLERSRLPASAQGLNDPFNASDPNPASCRAIESSLWEATALQEHYVPEVARFASVLERDHSKHKKTQDLPVSELTSRSFDTLIEEELRRRLKGAPTEYYFKDSQSISLLPNSQEVSQLGENPFASWSL
jgi:U3 small nucleolar RNA-associated protein 19